MPSADGGSQPISHCRRSVAAQYQTAYQQRPGALKKTFLICARDAGCHGTGTVDGYGWTRDEAQ